MGFSRLPQDLLAGSFTSSHAAAYGVSRKRQRQPDLAIPSRGIRVPLEGGATTPANLRAYTALDDASTLTHHSGARIWGYSLPAWMQEDWRIHVARDRGDSKPRRRNVVGHRLTFRPGEVVIHDGARVTSPARNLARSCQPVDRRRTDHRRRFRGACPRAGVSGTEGPLGND